jgi:hypothetical protein
MPGSRFWTAFWPLLAGIGWLALAWPLLLVAGALADDSEPLEDTPAAAEGVLVMRNGTVMAGTISQMEDYYEVRGQYGNVQVPASLVKMRCAGLEEAYLRLHDLTVAHHSANSHVTLAKWCVTNELDKEAIQELQAALKLEPDREDVQRMLLNATETLKSGRKSTSPQEPASAIRPARPASSVTDDAATLGGLSLSQALHYTRRIQPLLVKTCATTGCHTRESQNNFQLYHVVPGKNSTRHASELNLAAVLEQIDMKKPAGSRLLSVPRNKHGRQGRPVFSGQRGEEQIHELEDWVQAVARDAARRGKSTADDEPRKSNARPASVTERDTASAGAGERDPFSGKVMAPATPFGRERREKNLSDNTGGDPFDPAGFNRQPAGGRTNR